MAIGHDLSGQIFGRLTAINFDGRIGKKQERTWKCTCTCGRSIVVRAYSLKSGNTQSCGCLALEVRSTHKKSGDLVYASWQAMKSRCLNPKSEKYPTYGAVGITVDPAWIDSFEQFFLDMGNRPSANFTIERIDGTQGYSKSNCVWADKETQANNTKHNHPITYLGETLNLSQWSRKMNIPVTTLLNRLDYRHLTVEEAFTFKPFQRSVTKLP